MRNSLIQKPQRRHAARLLSGLWVGEITSQSTEQTEWREEGDGDVAGSTRNCYNLVTFNFLLHSDATKIYTKSLTHNYYLN